MEDGVTEKLDIAIEHLTVALRLYYETGEFYAALHLAGAAEDLLSEYLKVLKEKNPKESEAEASVKIAKRMGVETKRKHYYQAVNFAKNHTKHMNGIDESEVEFNAQKESFDMIDRAIANYYILLKYAKLKSIPYMDDFNKSKVK